MNASDSGTVASGMFETRVPEPKSTRPVNRPATTVLSAGPIAAVRDSLSAFVPLIVPNTVSHWCRVSCTAYAPVASEPVS